MLPLRNKAPSKKSSFWFDTDSGEKLTSVNVKLFNEDLSTYDNDIAAFNNYNAYQQKIDNFCLQYVATTRAADQLFLYIEKEGSKNYLDIYSFLKDEIPRQENGEEATSFDLYKTAETDLIKNEKQEKNPFATQTIKFHNKSGRNPETIKIATPSKSYQNRVENVRIGIFTHEILALINTHRDIENVLERYLLEGTITTDERNQIQERISNIIDDEKYKKYFGENLKVINEKDIMISEDGLSTIYRPDRLIEIEEGYIIIDFKTGVAADKHQVQLDEYQRVLEKLGKIVIDTKIIYV